MEAVDTTSQIKAPRKTKTPTEMIKISDTDRKVNQYKNKAFAFEYCVHDNKLYKKLNDTSARECTPQNNKHGCEYYYVKSKDGKTITVNKNKLDDLTYVEKNERPSKTKSHYIVLTRKELEEFMKSRMEEDLSSGDE
jgi:hypothetical protein